MYKIKPASLVRNSMVPNTAVVEVISYLEKKIKNAASAGDGVTCVEGGEYKNMLRECPVFGGLGSTERRIVLDKIHEAFTQAGYKTTGFSINQPALITIEWA